MARRTLALVALVVSTGTVAGCGHTQVVGASHLVHLALTEYRLSPQRVLVQPGQLTIYVKNDGIYTHDLAVTRGSKTIGATRPIAPGHRTHVTLTLRAGNYLMASTMLSDQDLGLYGTLIAK